jgi:hypothetical protein
MENSKIEQLIRDKEFSYLQPYFYNNRYALRCELGVGEGDQYMINAKNRAMEIFNILFADGIDAIIFNYWIFDYSDSGCAEKIALEELEITVEESIHNTLESEADNLRFLLEMQAEYRHFSVRDLETYGDFDDEYPGKQRRNRIVCYSDGKDFDYCALIDQEINGNGHNVGFVSFQNECIMSVYDDRGCDIVFATHEKMKEFYHALEPYFLSYDAEEMKKRFNK